MKKILFIIIALLAANTLFAQDGDGRKYTGKIGQYDITMNIHIGIFCERDDFDSTDDSFVGFGMTDIIDVEEGDSCGYYYYNSRPQTKFTLKVKSYAGGDRLIELSEYTPKGTNSGTFEGNFGKYGSTLKGTFTNNQGEKFQFDLKEED